MPDKLGLFKEARAKTKYEAYCLQCLGGGKSLGQPGSKKEADRLATSHMNTMQHRVTIIEHPAK